LIAGGIIFGTTKTDLSSTEVINIDNSASACNSLVDFPSVVSLGVGFVVNKKYPLVCDPVTSNCYSYEKGVWTPQSPLQKKRIYSAFAYTKDLSLYVSGGTLDFDNALNTMDYSTSGVWSSVSSTIPVPIKRHCMERLNSMLLVVGGVTGISQSHRRGTIWCKISMFIFGLIFFP